MTKSDEMTDVLNLWNDSHWPTMEVLAQVSAERRHQYQKWGQQDRPDGTDPWFSGNADIYKMRNEVNAQYGADNWLNILEEEVYEAAAETNTAALRKELVQVAAVAVAWIEAIDRRDH